jgi:hypothetical protein
MGDLRCNTPARSTSRILHATRLSMREDLENEQEALNSIYGEGTLISADAADIFVLRLPDFDGTLRLQFPQDYPDAPPTILGTESSGEHARKGDAAHVLEAFREAVGRLFQPGEVCLFDVIEDLSSSLSTAGQYFNEHVEENDYEVQDMNDLPASAYVKETTHDEPPWTISDVSVELKSVFVARCAPVSTVIQAKEYLQHLLNTDKKVAKATHNITAWRIKGENGVTFQDCDDDGETAAGGRVLHLMQLMDLWNVMVVVTRWYGGQKLGPARFGIINTVARDAFVKGGFVHEQESAGTSKKKGKR